MALPWLIITIGDNQAAPPVVVTPPTQDPGGHRARLLQELDRQQRQAEFDRRHEDLKAAELEQRSRDEQQRSLPERQEQAQPDQPKPELTATSPLPMVANFGMGPVTIGVKLPSLGEAIQNEILADDEDAIIAIILAAQ